MATIKQMFKAIGYFINDVENFSVEIDDVEITRDDILEFVEKNITKIEEKAARGRERSAAKRAESDALTDRIEATLTDEYQTAADIIAVLDEEDLTPQKVSSRISKLIKAGKAHKILKKEDGHNKTYYAAGPAPEVDEDTDAE